MPQATFKSVYAVSSEDPAYPASNLLKIQSGKRWKTQNAGEKSAFVILQLEEPQKITGIDIGNEHSSFVEVFVGKMGCGQDDFKEILLMCSFMTPIESKNSTNQNRVRCFAQNALVESIAGQKWDLVKAICTQPFNKHIQYGLSFIKIHVAELKDSKKELTPLVPPQFLKKNDIAETTDENNHQHKTNQLGKFTLREDSPESESETSVGLFDRWKQARNTPGETKKKLSTAAAIRQASSPSSLKTKSEQLKPMKISKQIVEDKMTNDETDKPVLDRNRNDLLFGEEDEAPNDKLERRISADQQRLKRKSVDDKKSSDSSFSKLKKFTLNEEKPSTSKNKPKIRPIQNTYPTTSTSQKRSSSPEQSLTNKAKKIKTEKQHQIEYRPFNQLLKGVVLVISGIQNPDRGELRRKALELGAKYKPDWDNTCTHLICAFKNTPKYNQVKGHGKIIKKHWIEKCYELKKRFPWRRYALDDKEVEKQESEEEIFDISLKPSDSPEKSPTSKDITTEKYQSTNAQQSRTVESKRISSVDSDPLELYNLEDNCNQSPNALLLTSGSDTEEEIEKIRKIQQQEKKGTPSPRKNQSPMKNIYDDKNIYDASTEEEEFTKINKANWTPPRKDFFADKKFFIAEKLGLVDKVKLKENIKTYGGELINTILEADFVITKDPIDDAPTGFKGELMKPLWIYECNEMEGFIPIERYKV